MTYTYQDRIATERRLLAALFLWPTECDLEPDHFVSPAHAALYLELQSIKRAPVSDEVLAVTYDDTALADIALWLMDQGVDTLFASVGGFWTYARSLQQSGDTREEIPSLISEIRECPRCGR